MITFVLVGLSLLVIVAIAVGIIDAIQAPLWRIRALDRRQRWEHSRETAEREASIDSGKPPDSAPRGRDVRRGYRPW
jgi:hypothetical protein